MCEPCWNTEDFLSQCVDAWQQRTTAGEMHASAKSRKPNAACPEMLPHKSQHPGYMTAHDVVERFAFDFLATDSEFVFFLEQDAPARLGLGWLQTGVLNQQLLRTFLGDTQIVREIAQDVFATTSDAIAMYEDTSCIDGAIDRACSHIDDKRTAFSLMRTEHGCCARCRGEDEAFDFNSVGLETAEAVFDP